MDLHTAVGRTDRGDTGFGDATLLARYTLGQWDETGQTLRLAAFAGLQLPTGDDNEADTLGTLPAPLQLGSGSWDPIVGTVFTWQTLDWQFDASAAWQFNTEANGYEFGDAARVNLSLQSRLLPRDLGEGVPAFLYAILESNLNWRQRDELGGGTVPASGGLQWHLAPGLQFVTERWIAEAAVQLPVIQNLNGAQLENDFIVTAGVRFWF